MKTSPEMSCIRLIYIYDYFEHITIFDVNGERHRDHLLLCLFFSSYRSAVKL